MTTPAAPDQINRDLAHAGIAAPLLAEEEVHRLPVIRGAYVLILNLVQEVHLDRPRHAARALSPGWYIYAGSARGPGGIRARLARHFREEKRIHWHIDQLTSAAGALICGKLVCGHPLGFFQSFDELFEDGHGGWTCAGLLLPHISANHLRKSCAMPMKPFLFTGIGWEFFLAEMDQ